MCEEHLIKGGRPDRAESRHVVILGGGFGGVYAACPRKMAWP